MKKNYLIILLGIGFLFSLTACFPKAESTSEPTKPAQETTVETSESTEIAAVTETEESTEDTTENTTETTAESSETETESTEVTAETTSEETVEGKEYFQYDGDIEPIVAETTAAGVKSFKYTPSKEEIEEENSLEEGRVMFRYATVKILVEVEEVGEGAGRKEQFVLEDVRCMLSTRLIPDSEKADCHKWFTDSDMYIDKAVSQYCEINGIGTHTYKYEVCEVVNEYWSSKKWVSSLTMNAHMSMDDWF